MVRILDATEEDIGHYSCEASNGVVSGMPPVEIVDRVVVELAVTG